MIQLIEAGHPVPDAAGLAATAETLALADAAGADDLVLVLMSGGASANWIAPAAGLSLAEKQALTRALLRSARDSARSTRCASISRASRAAGSPRALSPARLVTLAISDVPGDDPAVIGSGPTVPDPTTLADARAIVARYRLDLPRGGRARARRSRQRNAEARRSRCSRMRRSRWRRARPMSSRTAEAAARAAGYECILLGDRRRRRSARGGGRACARSRASCARRAAAP